MFRVMSRHRRMTLLLLSLTVALVASAFVWAFPAGEWVLTPSYTCVDSSLYCVVWEFDDGDYEGPCCVTPSAYSRNDPTCTNFRVEEVGN